VRPRKDKRGVDLNFRCTAIRLAVVRRARRDQQRDWLREHRSRSQRAVIRVYDEAGNVIDLREEADEFKEP
jgi:hypothetical protein